MNEKNTKRQSRAQLKELLNVHTCGYLSEVVQHLAYQPSWEARQKIIQSTLGAALLAKGRNQGRITVPRSGGGGDDRR